jgi:predicted MPP superfamily phosphohydrolase
MNNFITGILVLIYCCTFNFSCTQAPHITNEAGTADSLNLKSKSSINFLVLGDWGRNGAFHQKDVAWQMKITADKNPLDFIFSVGDNFYPTGVMSATDPEWYDSYENIYNFKSLRVPWYTVFGNHDYFGSIAAQLEYNVHNYRWKTTQRYYSFEKAIPNSSQTVLFVFLDTNPFDQTLNRKTESDLSLQDTAAQKKWLDRVLSTSTSRWKIAIGHHPIFTTGARKGQLLDVRNSFLPLFEKYQVNAYFAGHEHDLQYQKPEGVTNYFVSGAGSDIRPVSPDESYTKFAVSDHGFMSVQLMQDSMHLQIINYQGKLLYQTVLTNK